MVRAGLGGDANFEFKYIPVHGREKHAASPKFDRPSILHRKFEAVLLSLFVVAVSIGMGAFASIVLLGLRVARQSFGLAKDKSDLFVVLSIFRCGMVLSEAGR